MKFQTTAARNTVIPAIALLMLAACGSMPPVVPDAEGMQAVSAIAMGCNKPYKLTQDCSGLSGAKRKIDLSGVEFKIAGSEDGTTVLIMNSKRANVAYEVSKKALLEAGVAVTKVEPVASGALLAGYIVTADADAYQLLSEHTVED